MCFRYVLMMYFQMKRLGLTGNKIGNKGAAALARCIFNIEVLKLKDCGIDGKGVELLTLQIKVLQKPVSPNCGKI